MNTNDNSVKSSGFIGRYLGGVGLSVVGSVRDITTAYSDGYPVYGTICALAAPVEIAVAPVTGITRTSAFSLLESIHNELKTINKADELPWYFTPTGLKVVGGVTVAAAVAAAAAIAYSVTKDDSES